MNFPPKWLPTVALVLALGAPALGLAQSTPPMPTFRVSVDFYEVEVRDVLGWIADEAGMNLVMDDSVRGRVTLKLDNVSIAQAFGAVMAASGLGWEVVGDIVQVGFGRD